jgi:hypothetical protein
MWSCDWGRPTENQPNKKNQVVRFQTHFDLRLLILSAFQWPQLIKKLIAFSWRLWAKQTVHHPSGGKTFGGKLKGY